MKKQRAYRLTYRGPHMPRPAVRLLSTAARAEHVRQQFAKMGLEVSAQVSPAWVSARRELDDAKYFRHATTPGLLSGADQISNTPARQAR